MKIENIQAIKKRFNNEWLLIRIDKVKNARPASGRLIEHSKDRTSIYKAISKYNRQFPVFITYSQDTLPKGYAAAFHFNA